MRVLIVEDDGAVARVLRASLEQSGHEVDTVVDGVAGLQAAQRIDYAMVILDIMLPGMSGIEICAKLRARQYLSPIVILSGLDTVQDRALGFEVGATEYLTKPFDFLTLQDCVNTLLSKPAAPAG